MPLNWLKKFLMEEPLFRQPDIAEAAVTFLGEFCDPFIPDNDMVIVAMYRASNEIRKLREDKQGKSELAKQIDMFQEEINSLVMRQLKQENDKLRIALLRFKTDLGAGEN